jgi:uncharacterized membrane protein
MSSIEREIQVDVPASHAFAHWANLEQLPRFMSGVQSVTRNPDDTTHWKVQIGPKTVEYDAEIVHERDRMLSWRSVDGKDHRGVVMFTPVDATTTRVGLRMQYEVEGVDEVIGDLLGFVGRRTQKDLENFKAYVENGIQAK